MIIFVTFEEGGEMIKVKVRDHKPKTCTNIMKQHFGNDCIIIYKCGYCYDGFLKLKSNLRQKYLGRKRHIKQYRMLIDHYNKVYNGNFAEIITKRSIKYDLEKNTR